MLVQAHTHTDVLAEMLRSFPAISVSTSTQAHRHKHTQMAMACQWRPSQQARSVCFATPFISSCPQSLHIGQIDATGSKRQHGQQETTVFCVLMLLVSSIATLQCFSLSRSTSLSLLLYFSLCLYLSLSLSLSLSRSLSLSLYLSLSLFTYLSLFYLSLSHTRRLQPLILKTVPVSK